MRACDDHAVAPRPNVFTDRFTLERGSLRLGTVRVLTRSPFDPPGPNEDPADRLRLLFDRSAATDEALPR